MIVSLGFYFLALALAPLLLGIIPRVKAWFAGRQGQPIFQVYYDLYKLFGKGAVYSKTRTWVFQLGPIVSLSAMLTVLAILPMFGFVSLLNFSGDLLLFAYLLAVIRFFMILSALDTGSPFEGMGASREAVISMLNEPTFFLILAILVRHTGAMSLSTILDVDQVGWHLLSGPVLTLTAISLFVVTLVENYRVPIDDPTTHLELTMIHEVMVLDNGGPDLGFILYTSCLKMWMCGMLLGQILIPPMIGNPAWQRPLAIFGVMVAMSISIGIVESIMARLRLVRVPSLLVGTTTLALLGFILVS